MVKALGFLPQTPRPQRDQQGPCWRPRGSQACPGPSTLAKATGIATGRPGPQTLPEPDAEGEGALPGASRGTLSTALPAHAVIHKWRLDTFVGEKKCEKLMPYFTLCHKNECVAQAHKFSKGVFAKKQKLQPSEMLSAPMALKQKPALFQAGESPALFPGTPRAFTPNSGSCGTLSTGALGHWVLGLHGFLRLAGIPCFGANSFMQGKPKEKAQGEWGVEK